MREGIRQEVCGHFEPVILNKNTIPGNIKILIDWQVPIYGHKPANAGNYEFKGQLEYLQCDYYIESLNRIPKEQLPNVNPIRDSNLVKQTKYSDFKRRFNVDKRYVVELMLHTQWERGDWQMPKAGEYLYNLGQYGYLNLFDPYLLRDAEILYSDSRFKVGVSINGFLDGIDRIEINGGYSGVISYFDEPQSVPLEEDSGGLSVGTTATRILSGRRSRKILFLSNNGTSRLFFMFASSDFAVSTNSPFLEPGESLSIVFDNATWSGGNQHNWVLAATRHYLPLSLYAIREKGSGDVTFQEFY